MGWEWQNSENGNTQGKQAPPLLVSLLHQALEVLLQFLLPFWQGAHTPGLFGLFAATIEKLVGGVCGSGARSIHNLKQESTLR
jgi:hypothetical protein